MSTAAMQQALEALEKARPLKADYVTLEHYLTLEHYDEAKRKHYAAMTALREALAQPAPEASRGEPDVFKLTSPAGKTRYSKDKAIAEELKQQGWTIELCRKAPQPAQPLDSSQIHAQEEAIECAKQMKHCAIVVSDWLAGGCDTSDIPKFHIAALVTWAQTTTGETPSAPEAARGEPLTVAEVEAIIAQHDYQIHGDRARYIARMTERHHGIGAKP